MGLLDRLRAGMGVQRPLPEDEARGRADDQAIARYRYLLRTAPPETLEAAHAEAFAQLSPEQRRKVLEELAAQVSPVERDAVLRNEATPQMLARTATRAELRQPGTLERTFGAAGPGWTGAAGQPGVASAGSGFGSLLAGSLLSSMAGTVLGSMIAQQFLAHHASGTGLLDAGAAGSGSSIDPDVARDVNAGLDTFGRDTTQASGDAFAGSDAGADPFGSNDVDPGIDAFDTDDNYGGFDSGDTFDV